MTSISSARRKIKILMVIDHLGHGGAQALLVDLATGLDRMRFEPVVCALRPSRVYLGKLQAAGIRTLVVGRGKYDPFKLLELIRLVRREGVDVVHTHLAASRVLGVLAGRLGGAKRVFSHDHSGKAFFEKHPCLCRWLLFPLDRFLLRFTDRLFAVSGAIADFNLRAKRFPESKVELLYNWIDPKRFRFNRSWRQELRKRWGVAEGALVVGAVGRLSPVKGYRHLVRAVPGVLQDCPGARFVLIGEGPERATLEALARELGVGDAILMPGFEAEVEKVYSALDLFVLPSEHEAFGLVLLEAMAAGLPLVATEVGGVPELAGFADRARLVPPGDAEALAAALVLQLRDAAPAGQAAASREGTVPERFCREAALKRIEEYYAAEGGQGEVER